MLTRRGLIMSRVAIEWSARRESDLSIHPDCHTRCRICARRILQERLNHSRRAIEPKRKEKDKQKPDLKKIDTHAAHVIRLSRFIILALCIIYWHSCSSPLPCLPFNYTRCTSQERIAHTHRAQMTSLPRREKAKKTEKRRTDAWRNFCYRNRVQYCQRGEKLGGCVRTKHVHFIPFLMRFYLR